MQNKEIAEPVSEAKEAITIDAEIVEQPVSEEQIDANADDMKRTYQTEQMRIAAAGSASPSPAVVDKRPQLFKPGQSGNPSGRPKGIVSVVHIMRQVMSPQKARKLCDTIIDQAISGSVKHAELALKLMGEMPSNSNNTPSISITNNTLNMSDELIKRAQLYAEQSKQLKDKDQ